MNWVSELLLTAQSFIFLGGFVLLIILAVRRYKIKQKETFEDREN